MAFTVKSRRNASSREVPNALSWKIMFSGAFSQRFGRSAWSSWSGRLRNVLISVMSRPRMRWTRRNRLPMMSVWRSRKTRRTSSGVAAVETS